MYYLIVERAVSLQITVCKFHILACVIASGCPYKRYLGKVYLVLGTLTAAYTIAPVIISITFEYQ